MNAHARTLPWFVVSALLLSAGWVRADLGTDGVLSLEWLVDSSDEIYRVEFAHEISDAGKDRGNVMYLRESLKQTAKAKAITEKEFANLKPPFAAKPDEEWILFVRRDQAGKRKVFRGINLTRPTYYYGWAAVTRKCKILKSKEAILKATKARIKLARRLPARTHREGVDKLRKTYGRQGSAPFGDPAPLEGYLGGMVLATNIDFWDTPPNDHDRLIVYLVVPVEADDRPRLLEAVRLSKTYPSKTPFVSPIATLVNFPGEETERVLRNVKTIKSWDSPTAPQNVLRYLHYRAPATDPLNKTLVGQWRLLGHREHIDIDLKSDQTFTMTALHPPRLKPTGDRWMWRGKGIWIVRDGKLSLHRTHSADRMALKWRTNDRDIFMHKQIHKVAAKEVLLDKGPPMKRR